ncbi:hypothetical protein D3C74_388460 [compost metagenome]
MEKPQLHQWSFVQTNGALDGIRFHLNCCCNICNVLHIRQIHNVQTVQLTFVQTAIPRFIALFGLTEDYT